MFDTLHHVGLGRWTDKLDLLLAQLEKARQCQRIEYFGEREIIHVGHPNQDRRAWLEFYSALISFVNESRHLCSILNAVVECVEGYHEPRLPTRDTQVPTTLCRPTLTCMIAYITYYTIQSMEFIIRNWHDDLHTTYSINLMNTGMPYSTTPWAATMWLPGNQTNQPSNHQTRDNATDR